MQRLDVCDAGDKTDRLKRRMNVQREHAAGEFERQPMRFGLCLPQDQRYALGPLEHHARPQPLGHVLCRKTHEYKNIIRQIGRQ